MSNPTNTEVETEPPSAPQPAARGQKWLKGIVAALLAAAIVAVTVGPTEVWLQQIIAWIQGLGVWGGVVFALIYIAGTVLFVPGSVLTVGAGFLFGLVWGTVIVSAASTLGALAALLVGRYLARDAVRERVEDHPRFHALYRAIEKDDFKVVLLTRLVPIFPFNFLNYAFGLTEVSWRKYTLASWLGMLPGTVVYVYAGAAASSVVQAVAVDEAPGATTYLLWGLGAVAVVVGGWLLTRRARSELDEILDEPDQNGSGGAEAS
jgi:uncharacterized membrane protein YdjX (TVP38/TMEM64 family)